MPLSTPSPWRIDLICSTGSPLLKSIGIAPIFFTLSSRSSIWHAQVFRLSTGKRSPSRKAIGGAGKTRVDGQTEAGIPALTVFTEAARYIKRSYDTVTFTQGRYSRADLLNNAHSLMAESEARLSRGSPLVHVEI